MVRVHVDTDIGSYADDACALAMLLGWPDVELAGFTTTVDPGGRRAGFVGEMLARAGRSARVAAGATATLTGLTPGADLPEDDRYWQGPVRPVPAGPGAALDLLQAGVDAGAVLVAIGPWTNLAALELLRPGSLDGVPVVAMGGWLDDLPAGFPPWGPAADWNVQNDTRAAEIVLGSGARLTLVPIAGSVRACLRAAHLPRLREAGAIGSLLAGQAIAHAEDAAMAELVASSPALPSDALVLQFDAVAVAVACGWPGVTISSRTITTGPAGGPLRLVDDAAGRPVTVVDGVDVAAFEAAWLEAVERIPQLGAP